MAIKDNPALMLNGIELEDGWKVIQQISRPKNATGGAFSQAYIVEDSDKNHAFLKAMDYHKAFMSDDPAKEIAPLVEAYNFEREVLEKCKNKNFSKIVRLLSHGSTRIIDSDPYTVVQYIIFELATGDIRNHINNWEEIDSLWTLRMLHNVAVGLKQLHGEKIAHQDLKPSNVLTFNDKISKITDLGRASSKATISPHDDLIIAGDKGYAPPEQLYQFTMDSWEDRRFSCDAYLFGSLILFVHTGVSMTSFLLSNIDKQYHWRVWGESYDEVLPYLQESYSKCMSEIHELLCEEYKDYYSDLFTAINQLCNPNPYKRGHPKDIVATGCQYSLERYSNLFDRLAKKAELLFDIRNRKK